VHRPERSLRTNTHSPLPLLPGLSDQNNMQDGAPRETLLRNSHLIVGVGCPRERFCAALTSPNIAQRTPSPLPPPTAECGRFWGWLVPQAGRRNLPVGDGRVEQQQPAGALRVHRVTLHLCARACRIGLCYLRGELPPIPLRRSGLEVPCRRSREPRLFTVAVVTGRLLFQHNGHVEGFDRIKRRVFAAMRDDVRHLLQATRLLAPLGSPRMTAAGVPLGAGHYRLGGVLCPHPLPHRARAACRWRVRASGRAAQGDAQRHRNTPGLPRGCGRGGGRFDSSKRSGP